MERERERDGEMERERERDGERERERERERGRARKSEGEREGTQFPPTTAPGGTWSSRGAATGYPTGPARSRKRTGNHPLCYPPRTSNIHPTSPMDEALPSRQVRQKGVRTCGRLESSSTSAAGWSSAGGSGTVTGAEGCTGSECTALSRCAVSGSASTHLDMASSTPSPVSVASSAAPESSARSTLG